MSSFSFPPPPPPPPKAVPAPDFADFSSRGRGRGRGHSQHTSRGGSQRGRGRGGSFSTPQNYSSNTAQHHGHGRSNPNFAPLRGDPDAVRGQKRKRDDFASRHNDPAPRKSDVAPAVPSFGGPLLIPTQTFPPLAKETKRHSAVQVPESGATKRKTNLFGLGVYGEESSGSEDEDDDEAAMAAASSNPLQVSYAGKTLNLSSNKALADWVVERKRNWPTKARIAAKKQQELKQQQDALRRKLEDAQARKKAESQDQKTKPNIPPPDSLPAKKLTKVEKLREKLAKAEAKAAAKTVIKVEDKPSPSVATAAVEKDSSSAPKNSLVDSTYADTDSSNAAASESSDDLTSSSSSEASSDDDIDIKSEPVEDSSTINMGPILHENTTTPRSPPPEMTPQICRSFASTGRCTRGKYCRYKHERAERKKPHVQDSTGKRTSLYQRFVEQEQEAEDRKILEAIKYLGQQGHLDPKQS